MEWIIILVILVAAVVFIRSRNKQQLAQLEREKTAIGGADPRQGHC